jgi:hypothetical protein
MQRLRYTSMTAAMRQAGRNDFLCQCQATLIAAKLWQHPRDTIRGPKVAHPLMMARRSCLNWANFAHPLGAHPCSAVRHSPGRGAGSGSCGGAPEVRAAAPERRTPATAGCEAERECASATAGGGAGGPNSVAALPSNAPTICCTTSEKNSPASWPYTAERNAKSTWKVSQHVPGRGPGSIRHLCLLGQPSGSRAKQGGQYKKNGTDGRRKSDLDTLA